MLKILKKNKTIIILLSFAYIYLVTILLLPSKVRVLTPGELENVKNVYSVEDVNINDSFNTISVYNWNNVTIFQKWITENKLRYDQAKTREDLTRSDLFKQGKISNDSSHNNAIITAYTYANKVDSNIKIDYTLKSLTIYDSNSSNLKVGDEIIEINNEKINTNNYEEYLTNLNIYDNSKYIRNKDLTLKILREDKTLDIDLNKNEALYFYPNYEIINTYPKYLGYKEDRNVGGPSGGAIQALSLYVSLINNENINNKLKSLKIAGTGTIETDSSNTVGNIGGVVQKYYTALNNKMDYLLLPEDNYNELRLNVSNISKKIKVISIKDFNDLVNFVGDL